MLLGEKQQYIPVPAECLMAIFDVIQGAALKNDPTPKM